MGNIKKFLPSNRLKQSSSRVTTAIKTMLKDFV